MHNNDERKLIPFVLFGLISLSIIIFTYLYFQGTKERSFSNVGKTLYIGDEYRILKYSDKLELEEKLKKLESQKKIKALFYIIRDMKQLKGSLADFQNISPFQIKLFLEMSEGRIQPIFGDELPSSFDKEKFKQFLELSIQSQLRLDLFDTAIWDICDYLKENIN